MTAQIISGVTVDLDDGPIRTEYSRSHYDGKPTARLIIGDVGQSIGIAVSNSNPETMRQLLEAVTELAAWVERQNAPKAVA
jgi:hypothetical protein